MPVVNFHLVEGHCTDEQKAHLLEAASQLYSEILASPVERVRAFITFRTADAVAVGGTLVSTQGMHAPFFEFIVLAGRPLAQRQQLMAGFTALLVETLGVQPAVVRGRCLRVDPEDWCIAGVGADLLRANEISARAAIQSGTGG